MTGSSKQRIIDKIMPKGKDKLSIDAVELLMAQAIEEAEKETVRAKEEQDREDKYGPYYL